MCSLKRLQRLWVFSLQKTVPFPFRELTVELDLTIINLSLFVCSNLNLFHACTFSSHPMSLLSSYIAPSCSLPHSIILYNFLLCMLFPTSSNGLPLILCNILLSYLNLSSYSFLLPILFPIFHHIQYHFSHPLILNVLYPLLLPLILAYFISSHTTTSYPTLSLLFILYHFHSSYRLSGCPILFLVILFCFLPPHILSYLLCSETVYSLHILYCSCLSFTTFSYPAPSYLRYFLRPLMLYYFLSSYTTSISYLFGSYTVPLLLILYHFFSCCKTSSHLILLSLTLTYFLSSYPSSSQCILLPFILYYLPSSFPTSFHLSVNLPSVTSSHALLLPLILYYFIFSYFTSSHSIPLFAHA